MHLATRSWKRQESRYSHRASGKECSSASIVILAQWDCTWLLTYGTIINEYCLFHEFDVVCFGNNRKTKTLVYFWKPEKFPLLHLKSGAINRGDIWPQLGQKSFGCSPWLLCPCLCFGVKIGFFLLVEDYGHDNNLDHWNSRAGPFTEEFADFKFYNAMDDEFFPQIFFHYAFMCSSSHVSVMTIS